MPIGFYLFMFNIGDTNTMDYNLCQIRYLELMILIIIFSIVRIEDQ